MENFDDENDLFTENGLRYFTKAKGEGNGMTDSERPPNPFMKPPSEVPPPPPLPTADTAEAAAGEQEPPIDIDKWFGQREQMIRQLKQRKQLLLRELALTAQRLEVLGVKEAVDASTAAQEKPRKTRAKRAIKSQMAAAGKVGRRKATDGSMLHGRQRTEFVFQQLTQQPERVFRIAKRLNISTHDASNALRTLLKEGRIVQSNLMEDGQTFSGYAKA